MLKTAHDAEEFMRTGARVISILAGEDLRGRIRCSRPDQPSISTKPLAARRGGPYVFNSLPGLPDPGTGARDDLP